MCPKSSLAIDGIMDVYQFSTTIGEVDEMRDYVKVFFFFNLSVPNQFLDCFISRLKNCIMVKHCPFPHAKYF